jgi:hypothetical protein
MREELEDGHFDTMGNFIYKKGEEQIKDAWLDNIDWAKIKKDAGDQWQQQQVCFPFFSFCICLCFYLLVQITIH